eukprot:TRINITY_DN2775_c0_g1_i1.p1 TRINITY_DN2775_c0_g1~~TRINITY_DN2775_c0_g1_i1.p1  ORF type:complete len:573 (+),score=182.70 TRINITY_DN2775_c0_g1_i1:36-1754(+)
MQGGLPMMMNPGIIILKEGADQSQGIGQLISNINACSVIVDCVRTTLGPRGQDKLIYSDKGEKREDGSRIQYTISNDGATIVDLLDVVHPAAKVLVDIAKSQDAEIGDGTTSVVLLAGQMLNVAKPFIEDGVQTQHIIKAFRRGAFEATKLIKQISMAVNKQNDAEFRDVLVKCAKTAMNSKLIANNSDYLAGLVVDCVLHLGADLNLDMVGVKKVEGGSMNDIQLVKGVAFERTFSYYGFEMQPKKFKTPKILCLNVDLELQAEDQSAEVRVDNIRDYERVVQAEWNIIFRKLDAIRDAGVDIVLSTESIGDLATQYFADNDMFCAGRVDPADLRRVCMATGAKIQTSVSDLNDKILGTCEMFEEIQIGSKRYNYFSGCPEAKTSTFILRGGAEQFMAEVHRSLHDAIMVVKRAVKKTDVVAGGGAIEMEVAKHIKTVSRSIAGKEQLLLAAYAKAFEVIPRQLCENAGFDPTTVVAKLKQAHTTGNQWCGVDINTGDVCDTYEAHVWEPASNKMNAIAAATEAACAILSVDMTITNPKSKAPAEMSNVPVKPPGGGMRRGAMPRVYQGNR